MRAPRVTFVGAGSMLAESWLGQTCLLIQWPETDGNIGHLLFDCGGGMDIIGRLSNGLWKAVNKVAISHLHPDHVGGLSGLALLNYFGAQQKLKLYLADELVDPLWGMLAPALQTLDGEQATMATYFERMQVCPDNWLVLGPNLEMLMFPTQHFKNGDNWQPSYGLELRSMVGERKVRFLYTCDTRFTPELMMARYEAATVIVHDCETYPYASGVHSHYDQLRGLPEAIRRKTWLVGYNNNFQRYVAQAEQDRFLGFVQPGQVFDFARSGTLLNSIDPLQNTGHESPVPPED